MKKREIRLLVKIIRELVKRGYPQESIVDIVYKGIRE